MSKSVFDWGNFASGALSGFGSLLGSGIEAWSNQKANEENIKMQKEFAQNGIQWKVQDAEKAGIHPAVALGAQTYQATPSSVGVSSGKGVSDAFKHFGSAINSYVDDKEEERNLQLESARLDIEAKKLEIQKMKKGSNDDLGSLNPNNYVPSLSNLSASNDVKDDKSSPAGSNTGSMYGVDSKTFNDITIDKNRDGTFSLNYGEKRQDLYSEGFLEKMGWFFRNTFSADKEMIAKDIADIRREARLTENQVVVPLPYRPLSGRRFGIYSKKDAEIILKKANSPWEQIKALFYMNDESPTSPKKYNFSETKKGSYSNSRGFF